MDLQESWQLYFQAINVFIKENLRGASIPFHHSLGFTSNLYFYSSYKAIILMSYLWKQESALLLFHFLSNSCSYFCCYYQQHNPSETLTIVAIVVDFFPKKPNSEPEPELEQFEISLTWCQFSVLFYLHESTLSGAISPNQRKE